VRTPLLTAQEIAKRLRQPVADVEKTLQQMEGNNRLARCEEAGQMMYQVPLKNERPNRSNNLLDSLFG
jgi:hypothetical protein